MLSDLGVFLTGSQQQSYLLSLSKPVTIARTFDSDWYAFIWLSVIMGIGWKKKKGLVVNRKKTEYKIINKRKGPTCKLQFGNVKMKQVRKFKIFGNFVLISFTYWNSSACSCHEIVEKKKQKLLHEMDTLIRKQGTSDGSLAPAPPPPNLFIRISGMRYRIQKTHWNR